MIVKYYIYLIIIVLSVVQSFQDDEKKPGDNVFNCFGNHNGSDFGSGGPDCENQLYYRPLSTVNNSEIVYLPDTCEGLLHDPSDRAKLSCCLRENEDEYTARLNEIGSVTQGALIECSSKRWMPSPASFGGVQDDGTTTDLDTGDYQLLRVLDTRYHIRTCTYQLQRLQCYRCSQDHDTILKTPDTPLYSTESSTGERSSPLFYVSANFTVHDTDTPYTEETGKVLTLCLDYYQELEKFCGFAMIRGTPFSSYYGESSRHMFMPNMDSGYIRAIPPNITRKFLASQDQTDGFVVSNTNCFRIPIPEYHEPVCSFIINDTWINEYKSNVERDIDGTPIDQSPINTSLQLLPNHLLILIILILINLYR